MIAQWIPLQPGFSDHTRTKWVDIKTHSELSKTDYEKGKTEHVAQSKMSSNTVLPLQHFRNLYTKAL